VVQGRVTHGWIVRHRDGAIARLRGGIARLHIGWRWQRRREPRPHGLPARLIVSLTSHEPRFATLHLSLQCLLDQTVRPDAIILWVDEAAMPRLPRNVLSLRNAGLIIATGPDIGPYGKILPALESEPAAFIVTADDDAYYHRSWLAELVDAAQPGEHEVVCHRAHRIELGSDHLPLPYDRWDVNLRKPEASLLVFPTGVGGVLFPPGVFHPDVLNRDLYARLCPTADDLWLYWMARRQGVTFRKIGHRRPVPLWSGSQKVSLHQINVLNGGNDRQMAQLIERFGFPMAWHDAR
jgi:hypothetical protein